MGLLNQPKLARTAKQGLMSPLEIQMDTMVNDPLRPNLSSRLTQQDLVNKGLLAIGMAPMGITKVGQVAKWPFDPTLKSRPRNALGQEIPPTKYELAQEQARINANKMLGLPENNTYLDRAKFYDVDSYHGTGGDKNLQGIDAFDMSRAETGLTGKGVYTTNNPSIAGGGKGNTVAPQGYATNEALNHVLMKEKELYQETEQLKKTFDAALKSGDTQKAKIFSDWIAKNQEELSGLGQWKTGGGAVYPLKVRAGKTFDPEKAKLKRSDMPKDLVQNIENTMHSVGKNPKGKWPLSYGMLDSTMGGVDEANKVLRDLGYESLNYSGGKITGVPIKHKVTMAFEPNQVRSRFAAFDPARAMESDLLAGLAPYLGIGGLLGLGYTDSGLD